MQMDELADFFDRTEDFDGSVKIGENLSKHTTMNVGGMAKIFLEPEDKGSLVFAVNKLIYEDIRFFVLGGGSNVVISDKGLDAVISTRKMKKIRFLDKLEMTGDKLEMTGDKLEVTGKTGQMIRIDSGASWGSVISFCKKNDLGGFEAFTGLSGTAGGALYMNATCFALSACDNLVSAEYFDLRDKKIHTYEKNDSDWGYKISPFQKFKTTDSTDFIILSAIFKVHTCFDVEFSEKCIASRKEKGHFLAPSSGSAFKNDAANGIIAGKVIDECGLKGFSMGGSQIAPWHGNFIINPDKKATASDVKNLSETVRKIVREKTGIELESEILFIGDDF